MWHAIGLFRNHGVKSVSFRSLNTFIVMKTKKEKSANVGFVMKSRYRICPACKNFSNLTEDHVFCMVCGEKMIDKCPYCQEAILYPIARHCPACGESYGKKGSINEDEEATTSNARPEH